MKIRKNININDCLYCVYCRSKKIVFKKKYFECVACKQKYPFINGIVRLDSQFSKDMQLSVKMWDKIYSEQLKTKKYLEYCKNYKRIYLKDTKSQIEMEYKKNKKGVYLEIGCGQFFLGQELANQFDLIIGIDVCFSALKIAKLMLDKKGIKNYLLIQGDILKLPLKENTIDLVYGGGVIEHFKNTEKCISELYRVLKPDGISFNTVPCLNFISLTYRQLWGNIPNIWGLKHIMEFIHIKILQGKHMKYGYEFSFLPRTIVGVHKRVGFNKVKCQRFKTNLEFIKNWPDLIKKITNYLTSKYFWFWPVMEVVAKK